MEKLADKTIGDIVATDYRTSRIFRSYGLDFCCGGKRKLSEACEKQGVDLSELERDLLQLGTEESETHNYMEWSLDFLIDYIINNHHRFVRTMIPELNYYASKVANAHGEREPELLEVLQKVRLLRSEILAHLQKEEEELFPLIKKMVNEQENVSIDDDLIEALEEEHDVAGALMKEIQELTNDFNPPETACSSYRVFFKNLRAFQQDLHKHVHLENNILFPKAMRLIPEF